MRSNFRRSKQEIKSFLSGGQNNGEGSERQKSLRRKSKKEHQKSKS
jgi:hypothetical protein